MKNFLTMIVVLSLMMSSCISGDDGDNGYSPDVPEGWRFVKSLEVADPQGPYILVFQYDGDNRVKRVVKSYSRGGSSSTAFEYSDTAVTWNGDGNGEFYAVTTGGYITSVTSVESPDSFKISVTYNEGRIAASKRSVTESGTTYVTNHAYAWSDGNLVEINYIPQSAPAVLACAVYSPVDRNNPKCNIDLNQFLFSDQYYSTVPAETLLRAMGFFGKRSDNMVVRSTVYYTENSYTPDETYDYEYILDGEGFVTRLTTGNTAILVNYYK